MRRSPDPRLAHGGHSGLRKDINSPPPPPPPSHLSSPGQATIFLAVGYIWGRIIEIVRKHRLYRKNKGTLDGQEPSRQVGKAKRSMVSGVAQTFRGRGRGVGGNNDEDGRAWHPAGFLVLCC